MSRMSRRILLECGAACVLHIAYLFLAQDLLLRLFYTRPLQQNLSLAVAFFAPFLIVGITFGLSIPPDVKVLIRAVASLFCLELIPALILAIMSVDNPCLHRPGFAGAACAQNAQDTAHIQAITFRYLILAPLMLSVSATLVGGYISLRDRTPPEKRMSPVLRVLCVLSGTIISLFGLGGVVDQSLSYPSRHTHQIIKHEGTSAVVWGWIFLVIGLSLIISGIMHRLPHWLGKMRV